MTQNDEYNGVAKTLHWLILALLICQMIVAAVMPHISRATPPTLANNLHFTFGFSVFALAVVRLGWRLIHGVPLPLEGLPRWQVVTSRIVHWSLYAVILVVPVLGWINVSYRGIRMQVFGFDFPLLTYIRGWTGLRWTGDVHIFLAVVALGVLVAVHVGAALYHHFVRKDRVLVRMLPGARRPV